MHNKQLTAYTNDMKEKLERSLISKEAQSHETAMTASLGHANYMLSSLQ